MIRAQDTQQLLQQRLTEIRESIAEDQARLRAYQWVETTELSLKGEVKRRDQNECRYGPGGEIQKTPLGAPREQEAPRGRRAKKVEEFKDYLERSASLLSRYLPRDAARMQEAFQSGKASVEKSSGTNLASLVFRDYLKSGDKVTFAFDTAAKKLTNYAVATYLDTPDEAVSVDARFGALADGTSFVEETVLVLASKQLQIRTTNFAHQKISQ
jgi:hypothetical protein